MAEGPIKVELVRENTADAGMLTDPNPSVCGRGGSWGWSSTLQPEEDDAPALQAFADALAAIEKRGPR